MYKSLNDAVCLDRGFYAPGDVEIWYSNDESFRDFLMGSSFLKEKGLMPQTLDDLKKTHILIGSIYADGLDLLNEGNELAGNLNSLDRIYHKMQGEVWSPHGEARDMIMGIHAHTTMSVGDIIRKGNAFFMVDPMGFTLVKIEVPADDDTLLGEVQGELTEAVDELVDLVNSRLVLGGDTCEESQRVCLLEALNEVYSCINGITSDDLEQS